MFFFLLCSCQPQHGGHGKDDVPAVAAVLEGGVGLARHVERSVQHLPYPVEQPFITRALLVDGIGLWVAVFQVNPLQKFMNILAGELLSVLFNC